MRRHLGAVNFLARRPRGPDGNERELLVDFDDYEHTAGECLSGPYAHFTEPKWCGHPACLFTSSGGDLAAVERRLFGHGYDAHQVGRMMESFYLPLSEQEAERARLAGVSRPAADDRQ